MKNILDEIKEGFVYFEGGMGTLLQEAGLKPGELPEEWNLSHPEVIQGIHKDYIKAGSRIIKTNTFGANALKYRGMHTGKKEIPGTHSLSEVIKGAFDNAGAGVRAFPEERVYISLDIGPLGHLLKPLGDLSFDDAYELFSEVVSEGVKNGADLILVETMTDIYEAKAAVLAAKESGLPVMLTCAFDESEKLMTGASPLIVTSVAEGLGADAVGVNCSLGPDQMTGIVRSFAEHASCPVVVSPNAGLPRTENGKTVYDVGPDDFAASMLEIAKAGARVLGGCCGTTPAHIKAMKDAIEREGLKPVPLSEKDETVITSFSKAVTFGKRPVLIGERINPTGKKRFKEALRAHDIDHILQVGLDEQDKGAEVLDVNVGLPEIDEPAMMEEAVYELQGVTDLPLQIDTTDREAMERALKIYNGKPMINSVNGKKEVMDMVFPLAKKYGGLIVALTIDEEGIPKTAEGRLEIAKKMYDEAAKYGIKKKDIIIDPLAMSISAEPDSAKVTLEALRLIRDELKGHTSLGVSNISFGLPERDLINSAFFVEAMHNGLSAAIMNPASEEMMKSWRAFNALNLYDENCMDYIEYAGAYKERMAGLFAAASGVETKPVKKDALYADIKDDSKLPLVEAVVKGMKERAGLLSEQMLSGGTSGLDIIDGALIPALDIVGRGFEKKTMFLPQLLMSAEAAAASFAVIKRKLDEEGKKGAPKGRIILATVKGDIHDIGKNIVKVLLENYDFEVLDLGKDVPPELIVKTAKDEGIKLVGLSALMTTTVPSMEETIKLLRTECPGTLVMVGGAVLTPEYSDMIGADHYSKDAMGSVRYAEQIFSKDSSLRSE